MFKKVLSVIAIVASTAGIATAAGSAPYIGAGLGVAANTSSNNSNYVFGSNRVLPFNVLAGYGGVISESFYLAGELNGTLGAGELNNGGKLKTTYSYGASVLPGVMLSDHTLAFARAGIVRTRFSSLNTNQTGGQFGLGLQTGLTQNVDLRGEYDFTAYRSINQKVNGVSFSTSPRQDAFNISLIYKFE